MITADYIRAMAATAKVSPGMIEKDYILSKTIMALAQINDFQNSFVFKGGTALKKCHYPAWRFSEDLDFTTINKLSPIQIKELFDSAVKEVESLFGVTIRVAEYSQYPREGLEIVSAQLKLGYDGPLRKTSGLKNNIRVDISLDETLMIKPIMKKIQRQYPDDIEAVIPVYTLEEIIAEKLRSILQRGKSRDYYDVWILLKNHASDFNVKLVIDIMKIKCHDKGIAAPTIDDFFQPERIEEARRYWERGLAHQINMLPNFIQVTRELKNLLSGLIK
jgi:predicted nucleotidyltransferase component of viral defense system